MDELVSKVDKSINQKPERYKIFKTKNEKPTDESVCIVKKYCSILKDTISSLKKNRNDENDSTLFKNSISSLNTMNNNNERCQKCKSWIEEKCIYCSKNDQEIILINEIHKDKIKENILENDDNEDIVIKTPKFYEKKFKIINSKNHLQNNFFKNQSSNLSENQSSKFNLNLKNRAFQNDKNELEEIKLEIDKFFVECNRFTKTCNLTIQNDNFSFIINNYKVVVNFSGVKQWNYQITSTYLYLLIEVRSEIIKSISKLIKSKLECNFVSNMFEKNLLFRSYKKEYQYVNYFKKINIKYKIEVNEKKELELFFKKYNDNFINNIEEKTYKKIKLEEKKKPKIMDSLESESSDMEIDEVISIEKSTPNEININKILFKVSNEETIIILKDDLKSLDNENYLNDKIIEFYLLFIKTRLIREEIAKKTYIFNTFFFSKLISSALSLFIDSKSFFENQYNQVKSWTKNVDIFDYDFLIIPLFKDHHWSLAIICYHTKILDEEIIDDDEDIKKEDSKYNIKPCIIFMNSLGNRQETINKFSRYLRNFLEKECLNKKKLERKFNEYFIPTLSPSVPLQTNGHDCGIFILHYVELFLKDPSIIFSNSRLKKLNLANWFDPYSILKKRKQIFNTLYNIHLSNLKEGIFCETDDESAIKSDEEIEIIKNSSINESKEDFLGRFLSDDEN